MVHIYYPKWNVDKANNHRPASAAGICAIKTRNGTRNIQGPLYRVIVLKGPTVKWG